MVRGVGLDAGEYEIKVVELDGSLRKPRLSKVSIERVVQSTIDAGDEGHARREAEGSLHALKDAAVAKENVTLGFPCREAVLRHLDIPFTGSDAIRKVIKFEAEGEIHSHSVDDMVVDFHVIEELEGETRVLVAAVPKDPLETTLTALRRTGIEPEHVDLDAMALYRSAAFCGCFGDLAMEAIDADEAEAEDEEAEAPRVPVSLTTGGGARLVLDVGARSVRVLAVVDGQLIDVRTLRIGSDSVAEQVAEEMQVELETARDGVLASLDAQQDVEIGIAASPEVEAESEGQEAELAPEAEEGALATQASIRLPLERVQAAHQHFLASLRRELLRFLSSIPQATRIDGVWVTGGGHLLPGVDVVLEEVLGATPQELDVLERIQHGLDDEEAAWTGPRIAVAFGLALGAMGGKPAFEFRREELVFTRKFDRLKFPLAVVCMLAAFLPFIYGHRQKKELRFLEYTYGVIVEKEAAGTEGEAGRGRGRQGGGQSKADYEMFGHVGAVMVRPFGGTMLNRLLEAEDYERITQKLLETEVFDRLRVLRTELQRIVTSKQEETGVYENLQLPSGYAALVEFADTVKNIESQLGEFLVGELDLTMEERNPSLAGRVAFRGGGARQRFNLFESAFRQRMENPESNFAAFADKGHGEEAVFQKSDVKGFYYSFKIQLKEDLYR